MRTEYLTLTFATVLGAAALSGLAVVAPAMARDVIVEHYDEDTGVEVEAPDEPALMDEEDGPFIVEDNPASPPTHYEPQVYGWVGEVPADCGTYKYWNGEHCADARYDLEN